MPNDEIENAIDSSHTRFMGRGRTHYVTNLSAADAANFRDAVNEARKENYENFNKYDKMSLDEAAVKVVKESAEEDGLSAGEVACTRQNENMDEFINNEEFSSRDEFECVVGISP